MDFDEIINIDILLKKYQVDLYKLETQNSDIQERIKELKRKISNTVNINLNDKKLNKKPVFYLMTEIISILKNAKNIIYKRCIESDSWTSHEIKKYTIVLHSESFGVKKNMKIT